MNATEICNLSLSILKASPINDIDGNDPKSNLCKRWYKLKKRNLLAENNWRFAIKRIFLARNTHYYFTLPSDLVRIIGLSDKNAKQFGNEIESEDSDLELYYISDVDESLFTPDFIQVFIFFLAHTLSFELVGDNNVTKYIEEQYQILLSRARSNGNIEFPLYRKEITSNILNVRKC
jgi:hypothetical protein